MNFLEEEWALLLRLDAPADCLAGLRSCPSATVAPCPLSWWHASGSKACEPTKMNCLDGIHYSVILINFELMNLHELMLTKYSPGTTSENKMYFDLCRSISQTPQTAVENNYNQCLLWFQQSVFFMLNLEFKRKKTYSRMWLARKSCNTLNYRACTSYMVLYRIGFENVLFNSVLHQSQFYDGVLMEA